MPVETKHLTPEELAAIWNRFIELNTDVTSTFNMGPSLRRIVEQSAQDGFALSRHVTTLDAELAAKGVCHWTYDDDDKWDTTCGHTFCLNNDDGPDGNQMCYCPYYGGGLVEEEADAD